MGKQDFVWKLIALMGIGLLWAGDIASGQAAVDAFWSNTLMAANTSSSDLKGPTRNREVFRRISETPMPSEEFWARMLGALEEANGSATYEKFKETFGDSLVVVTKSNGWNIYGFYLGGYSGQIFEEPIMVNGTPYIRTTFYMSILVKINLETKYCITTSRAISELNRRGWKLRDKFAILGGYRQPFDTFSYNNGPLLLLFHYDHPAPFDDENACVTEVKMTSGKQS